MGPAQSLTSFFLEREAFGDREGGRKNGPRPGSGEVPGRRGSRGQSESGEDNLTRSGWCARHWQ